MNAPQASLLPDGRRLHLHHGPIDLIIGASDEARDRCFAKATQRFETLLTGLVAELDLLRQPLTHKHMLQDPVARRMASAVAPFDDVFVTPMAAVAGAVADEVLAAMLTGHTPRKVYVNNGGDIAFHLSDDAVFNTQSPTGPLTLTEQDPSRGIATSGWQGRSHSLGIADAVTVTASTAAAADVAATLIANAVDLPGHPAIERTPANLLSPDSDLGPRPVTTAVGGLTPSDIQTALLAGAACASAFRDRGLIHQAAITLRGQSQIISSNDQRTGDLVHA